MTAQSRYELWRRKLGYLVAHHGSLASIARAAGLKPQALDQIVKGIPAHGCTHPPHLNQSITRQIERSLDLPDGWFDAPAFLPSRL